MKVGNAFDGALILSLGGILGKRNDAEDAKEKLYTYASPVTVISFKVGLFTWDTIACAKVFFYPRVCKQWLLMQSKFHLLLYTTISILHWVHIITISCFSLDMSERRLRMPSARHTDRFVARLLYVMVRPKALLLTRSPT